MASALRLLKDNLPLSVCAVGAALIGYAFLSRKVDEAAQKKMRAHARLNSVDKLEISPGKITVGQGEYIVFHIMEEGEKRQVSKETFEKVYPILNYYTPMAIMARGSPSAKEECANRYRLTRNKVKEIDPTLEVVFVPRTLCDLIFIRKCVQEDLKHNSLCTYSVAGTHRINLEFFGNQEDYNSFLDKKKTKQAERKCLHLCYFQFATGSQHPDLKRIAYRLNRAMVKILSPGINGLRYDELAFYTEREIKFLQDFHTQSEEEMAKIRRGEKSLFSTGFSSDTLTYNIGCDRVPKSLAVASDSESQIIRNSLILDCSEMALKTLFIYRGSEFEKDSPYSAEDENRPYSLSYGSSLFAGCVYDQGATAFCYMRWTENAFVIPIPFDEIQDSPFFVPHPGWQQNYGDGEIFHARSKAWKGSDLTKIDGITWGHNHDVRDHLQSNLTKDQLVTQFYRYKKQAIHLK